MDTMLALTIVVLFSGWIFRLKTEISTLERLVGVGDCASPQVKSAHQEDVHLAPSPVYDRTVKPLAVQKGASAASGPNAEKTARKCGVRVWTIDG